MRIIKRETYRFLKTLSYSLEQVFIELIKTPHILGICGIGMKIESLPKFNLRLFFKFTASRYAFLFFVSKIQMFHVISHE